MPALLQAGRRHKLAERAALVAAFVEDRRGGLDNLPPCLFAFGHILPIFNQMRPIGPFRLYRSGRFDASRDQTVSVRFEQLA